MGVIGKIAFFALEQIQNQIDEGIDIEGKSYSYSTKPYWRPYDKKIIQKLGGKRKEGVTYRIIKRENESVGMIVLGGYKQYKQLVHPDVANSFLTVTGNLRSSMTVARVDDVNLSAELGFSDKEAAQIAFYLTRSGVGRGRKLWKFWGLTAENKQKLTEYAGKLISENVKIDEDFRIGFE